MADARTREAQGAEWRELHNEGLCGLCSSPNIIRVFKSGTMIWGACSTHGGELLLEILKETDET
jgi:hypothetical protein